MSVEEWLSYGSPESLALFMYGQPKRAKRLYFDVIPKAVDEYFTHLGKLPKQSPEEGLENPAWHIDLRATDKNVEMPVSFSLLLNLAAVCSAETADELWDIFKAMPPARPRKPIPISASWQDMRCAFIRQGCGRIKNTVMQQQKKTYIAVLRAALAELPENAEASDVQSVVYAAGKERYENLRDWFKCLYETMLGQEQGPRMGSFFRLYGLSKSIDLCDAVYKIGWLIAIKKNLNKNLA